MRSRHSICQRWKSASATARFLPVFAINATDKSAEISNIIDHAEKVPIEKSREALNELQLSNDQVEKILAFMFTKGTAEEVEAKLAEIIGDLAPVSEGLDELKTVFNILKAKENMSDIEIDLMIIRGLDYYTGTVYETFLKDYREIGSISSGGRYENLANNFTDQKFPGVGGSIGLTRLFFVLNEIGLLDKTSDQPIDYVLIPLSTSEYNYTFKVASSLRVKGYNVDIDFDDRKLGNKFNRASKIAKYAVVIGENEAATGNIQAKNLSTGESANLEI